MTAFCDVRVCSRTKDPYLYFGSRLILLIKMDNFVTEVMSIQLQFFIFLQNKNDWRKNQNLCLKNPVF